MSRLRFASSVAASIVFVVVASCGDQAKLPCAQGADPQCPAGPDDPRAFQPPPCAPIPEAADGAPTFFALYKDIFAPHGIGGCQNGACHGKLGDDEVSPVGQDCLAMSSSRFSTESPGAPFGNPAGAYCALTGHLYGGRPVVNNQKPAYQRKTDDVVTEGTKVCCDANDPLYKATDCAGGTAVTTTVVSSGSDTSECAVATNTGHCAIAYCRTDAILKVLDPTDGFMPNSLPTCNRKLTRGELDRIFKWLQSGAKYDGFPTNLPPPKCTTEDPEDCTRLRPTVCEEPPGNRACD